MGTLAEKGHLPAPLDTGGCWLFKRRVYESTPGGIQHNVAVSPETRARNFEYVEGLEGFTVYALPSNKLRRIYHSYLPLPSFLL